MNCWLFEFLRKLVTNKKKEDEFDISREVQDALDEVFKEAESRRRNS